jgi:hypothetical protein
MARPIPINEAGLQHGRRFNAQPYAPAWGIPWPAQAPVRRVAQRAPAPRPRAAEQESWRSMGILLLAASCLAGALAVTFSLELWSPLAASSVGLDEQAEFLLLVSGVYLLATTFYAAWRTRLLQDLHQAPWDARLMAYANLGVGGVVSMALGVMALAIVGIILLLVGFIALLLSGTGRQPRG